MYCLSSGTSYSSCYAYWHNCIPVCVTCVSVQVQNFGSFLSHLLAVFPSILSSIDHLFPRTASEKHFWIWYWSRINIPRKFLHVLFVSRCHRASGQTTHAGEIFHSGRCQQRQDHLQTTTSPFTPAGALPVLVYWWKDLPQTLFVESLEFSVLPTELFYLQMDYYLQSCCFLLIKYVIHCH